MSFPRPKCRTLRSLRRDLSGVAVVEFALATPLVLLLGLTGAELANLVLTHLRVSQAALALADNASRIGITSDLAVKQVSEAEVNEILTATDMQGGSLGLMRHGRVILSSLQVNSDGGQWIAWQRCQGLKRAASSYGAEGDGRIGTSLTGMGPPGRRIRAVPDSAVMFVEVSYDYQPIIAPRSLTPQTIHYTAAYTVRDRRDLTQLYSPSPRATKRDCSVYSAA
ncbi:pilus assembly protein [Brevundimonas diminuta]|uniref:TadE/TadG family type IV pilus assembly protein n=1 Tax=Brevundimonas diminuta TaxID=293 RepID=UPI0022AF24B7|nr:TadE/TadG family type IV pilus assembly protein [Brevundimonas diminuta]MCZ4107036.1 pilus assembly protein [Brevundimonas diminuta]